MSDLKIIRFEPNGPAGRQFETWEAIDPASLVAGTPVQRGHLYHELPELGYSAGVWDCTALTSKVAPYEVNEFMLLLEGSVTIAVEGGEEVTIQAGESFVIPQGLRCSWKQTGRVRKYFVIFEDKSGRPHADPAALGVIRPQKSGPAQGMTKIEVPNPEIFISSLPTQYDHGYFEDATHQMFVGLWESTPFERSVVPFPRNELMCILEGSVTLTDGDGTEHVFAAGDAAYVPMGTRCSWKSTETVRKFYAIFVPAA
jgi:uncharacterized cupin superfamily protein